MTESATCGGPEIVRLRGEYDIATRAELSAALQSARATGDVVLDLTDLVYVDSSGIDEMFRLSRSIKARDGRFALVIATQSMRRLMSIAGLTSMVPVFETLDEAIAAAATPPG